MKLIIYTHAFAPGLGGVETYTMLLATGLAKQRSKQRLNLTVITAKASGDFDDSQLTFPVVRRPGALKLYRLIRTADVVHLAGPALLPLMTCVLLGVPVVIEHHGYQAICPNGLMLYEPNRTACTDRFMKGQYLECVRCNAQQGGALRSFRMLLLTWPRRMLCKLAAVNLCVTHHVASRVRLPKSEVVYHGVPRTTHKEMACDATGQSTRKSGLKLAYVGRLVQEKGVPTLIQAIHQLREDSHPVHLTIIGDGPERERLTALANNGGLPASIDFIGTRQGAALETSLADVDVLVLPSIWEEPAGLVVLEHLMRGRPVIVSDNGGAAELAGDAGLKFPPGDVASLTECIRRFLDEPGLIGTMGSCARERALAMFSEERMVEEHYEIYTRIVKREDS